MTEITHQWPGKAIGEKYIFIFLWINLLLFFRIPPPEELQNLMHRNFYRCQYYQGSPLRASDLTRVKVNTVEYWAVSDTAL